MNIEMNMNGDKIEEPSVDVEYGDEILNTGWNPAVNLINQEHIDMPEKAAMPPDLTAEVIEVFLRKMYAMQR